MTLDLSIYRHARAAFDEANEEGKVFIRWEFMEDAWRQLLKDLDIPRPHIHVGMKVEPLFDVPVEIVAGAQKEFRLIAEEG